MRDAMVDLLFLRVRLSVTLADTFGDNAGVTLGVASVLAVLALHTGRVLEEISAERTAHDIVELLRYEFVSLFLVDFFLSLTNRTLPIQTNIDALQLAASM